jgi:hypothetical protein
MVLLGWALPDSGSVVIRAQVKRSIGVDEVKTTAPIPRSLTRKLPTRWSGQRRNRE